MSSGSTQEIALENNEKYFGQVENGKKSGYGILVQKNGDIYEGGFKEDQKHGKGRLTYTDGS